MEEGRQPDDDLGIASVVGEFTSGSSRFRLVRSDEDPCGYILERELGPHPLDETPEIPVWEFLAEMDKAASMALGRYIMSELYPRDLEPLVGTGTEILSVILTQLGNLTSSLVSLYRFGSTDADVIYRQMGVVVNAVNSLVDQTLAVAPIRHQEHI